MNSYYNIIKIAPNPTAGDTISIGLLVFNSNQFMLKFSSSKKRIAKSLLGIGSEAIDYITKQIQNKIDELNTIIYNSNDKLFEVPSIINADYFTYLSKYSNNILQFNEPNMLSASIDENGFNKLFEIFVGKDDSPQQKDEVESTIFYQNIEERLIKRVKDKVHTKIQLSEKFLPSLYFNYDLDCVGMNGVITGAKSIDFTKGDQTIIRHIANYFQVTTLMANKFNKGKEENNFYVIGDEPSAVNSKEHKIWESFKKQTSCKLIHSEQSDIVAEKIEKTKAKEFLESEIV